MLTTAPRGTKDIMPSDVNAWRYLEETMRKICAQYGYKEIRTPVFEHTELFQRGIGDTTDVVEKEMYTFTDRGNRSITLRPENTASAVRAYVEHKLSKDDAATKFYYIGPMFRYDRPQAGRLREFHQFGVEALGVTGPNVDAEIILLAVQVLQSLGLKDLKLKINSVGCPKCRPQHREKLQAFFKPNFDELCKDCQGRFDRNPLRLLDCKNPHCHELGEGAPSLEECLCDECKEHFEGLKQLLTAAGVEYEVDHNLVRGLDYYTKTAFEIQYAPLGAQSAVCGGGRYDDLTGIFGMPNMSGVGISFGADRIYDVMTGLNLFPEEVSFTTRVFFTNLGAEEEAASLELLRSLRDAGVAAEIYPECGKMKKQMEYANRRSIPYVVIIGSQELEAQAATVKDMRSGEQRQVPFAALAADLESRR